MYYKQSGFLHFKEKAPGRLSPVPVAEENQKEMWNKVTVYGSGTRIYCVFRENMIQVRGDYCEAKL